MLVRRRGRADGAHPRALSVRGDGDVVDQQVIVAHVQDRVACEVAGGLGLPHLGVGDDGGVAGCHRCRLAADAGHVVRVGGPGRFPRRRTSLIVARRTTSPASDGGRSRARELDGLRDPVMGYGEMVAVVASNHVSAEPGPAKAAATAEVRPTACSRSYLQGAPASYELVGRSSSVGVVAVEPEAAPLGLDDAGDDGLVCDGLVRLGDYEGLLARAGPR